jgi:hypothetical protein
VVAALAIQPTQQDGDGPRVMSQVVTRPGDDPQVG